MTASDCQRNDTCVKLYYMEEWIIRGGRVAPHDRVGIIGAGPIGLFVIEKLSSWVTGEPAAIRP